MTEDFIRAVVSRERYEKTLSETWTKIKGSKRLYFVKWESDGSPRFVYSTLKRRNSDARYLFEINRRAEGEQRQA